MRCGIDIVGATMPAGAASAVMAVRTDDDIAIAIIG